MAGYNIGIGIGIRYDTDIEKKFIGETVQNILDALLLEDGRPLLLEDGRYMQLESETVINKTKTE